MQETNYGIHTASGGISVFISDCKHFPHASLSISDTEVLKEMKEKYYDRTLMKINLFSFAPGSIMTTTSRLRWFQMVLFHDFMFLQGANAATIWMRIWRITLVAKM